MEQLNLTCKTRTELGKGPSGRLRKSGWIPAVLYGPKTKDAQALSIPGKDINKCIRAGGGNVLVNLSFEGEGQSKTVMFKEVVRHPLTSAVDHIDFIEILMDHRLVVEVPVHITGKAVGIAFGGIVQQEARKVRVECLPAQIPSSIDMDVTPLGIGHAFHARDIKLGEGLRVVGDLDMTIVSVVAPTAEVAPKTAEEVQAELAKSFEEKEEKEEKE